MSSAIPGLDCARQVRVFQSPQEACVLAATLAAVGTVPVESVALILGIHRLMSQALAPTNLIGNGVATLVIAKWERALDERQLQRRLAGKDAEQA
jgi:aerobic C4-dicarboxylate transport protein